MLSTKKPHDISRAATSKTTRYSALIASTGHSSAQAPQSTHVSALISYLLSPSLIASTGQTGSQLPHFVHASEITYAMTDLLLLL